MSDDDLRELELALDTHGRLSLEDTWHLICEVRRRGDVIVQMQQAIDVAGDSIPTQQADQHFPVGADQGAPRLLPGEEP